MGKLHERSRVKAKEEGETKVTLQHDLTPVQRKEYKDLMSDAKKLRRKLHNCHKINWGNTNTGAEAHHVTVV